MNIFEFMSGSPVLTFFLFLLVFSAVEVGLKALGGKYKCNCRRKDEYK